MTWPSYSPPVACDGCGARADTAHLLPYVVGCERVEFACPKCDPGGYWFELRHLWEDGHSMAQHVAESKRDGYRALSLLFARLADAANEDERLWEEEQARRHGAGLVGLTIGDMNELAVAVEARWRERFREAEAA